MKVEFFSSRSGLFGPMTYELFYRNFKFLSLFFFSRFISNVLYFCILITRNIMRLFAASWEKNIFPKVPIISIWIVLKDLRITLCTPIINCCIFLKLCTWLYYSCMLQAYATDIMWNKQMLKLNVTRMIYRPNEPKRICTENAPKTICISCASRYLCIAKSRKWTTILVILLIQIRIDGIKTRIRLILCMGDVKSRRFSSELLYPIFSREWLQVKSEFCVKKWSNFKYFLVHIDQSYLLKAPISNFVIIFRMSKVAFFLNTTSFRSYSF